MGNSAEFTWRLRLQQAKSFGLLIVRDTALQRNKPMKVSLAARRMLLETENT